MRSSILAITLLAALAGASFVGEATAANGGAALAVRSPGLHQPILLVAEPDSGALVLFADTRSGGLELYAQRTDHLGHPTGADGGVKVLGVTDAAGFNDAVADGAGGAIVAFTRDGGPTGSDIVVQRVLPDASLGFGPTGLVVCSATATQSYPLLVAGTAGDFYVTWHDARAAASYEDIYAQRLTLAGAAQWTANGIPVNGPTYRDWGYPTVAPDLQGGLFVTWHTASPASLRLQRVDASGTLRYGAAGATYGVADNAGYPVPAGDGSGGAWVAWSEGTWNGSAWSYQAWATHFSSAGVATIASRGVAISPTSSANYSVLPIRDATSGCFVYNFTWNPGPYGAELFRQHVDATGIVQPGAYGESMVTNVRDFFGADVGGALAVSLVQVATNSGRVRLRVQRYALDGTPQFPGAGVVVGRDDPQLVVYSTRPAGGPAGLTLVGFTDSRYFSPNDDQNYQAFGQALGPAGDALWEDGEAPVIRSARDFPNDQGGALRVKWTPGCADQDAAHVVTGYRVWRALPGDLATRILAARPAGAASAEGTPFEVGGRTYLATAAGTWEAVGESPAARLASYALTVPTGQDSIAGANADETFMVEAYDDSSHQWFTGEATGHSVDNLAPGMPAGASAFYAIGATTLYWQVAAAPDLCCYEVYRGGDPSFVPSAANRITVTSAQALVDPTPGAYWFRIAGRDVHGNLGASVLVAPGGTAGVDDAAPHDWALRAAWVRSAGQLVLALDVPHADDGELELFDVAGRRLWSTPFRAEAAGTMRVDVDGARLRPGLVLARVRARSGRDLVARTIVIR